MYLQNGAKLSMPLTLLVGNQVQLNIIKLKFREMGKPPTNVDCGGTLPNTGTVQFSVVR